MGGEDQTKGGYNPADEPKRKAELTAPADAFMETSQAKAYNAARTATHIENIQIDESGTGPGSAAFQRILDKSREVGRDSSIDAHSLREKLFNFPGITSDYLSTKGSQSWGSVDTIPKDWPETYRAKDVYAASELVKASHGNVALVAVTEVIEKLNPVLNGEKAKYVNSPDKGPTIIFRHDATPTDLYNAWHAGHTPEFLKTIKLGTSNPKDPASIPDTTLAEAGPNIIERLKEADYNRLVVGVGEQAKNILGVENSSHALWLGSMNEAGIKLNPANINPTGFGATPEGQSRYLNDGKILVKVQEHGDAQNYAVYLNQHYKGDGDPAIVTPGVSRSDGSSTVMIPAEMANKIAEHSNELLTRLKNEQPAIVHQLAPLVAENTTVVSVPIGAEGGAANVTTTKAHKAFDPGSLPDIVVVPGPRYLTQNVTAPSLDSAVLHGQPDALASFGMGAVQVPPPPPIPTPREGSRNYQTMAVNLANDGEGHFNTAIAEKQKVKQWDNNGSHMVVVDAKVGGHHVVDTSVASAEGTRTTHTVDGKMQWAEVDLKGADGRLVVMSRQEISSKGQLAETISAKSIQATKFARVSPSGA